MATTGSATTPKCVIPNGDSASSHNDAAKIIQKLHQLEVGQKKIIHLLNNLDKELSARAERQRHQCCFKHNNSSLNNGSLKSITGSFKTESFFYSMPYLPFLKVGDFHNPEKWVVVGFLSLESRESLNCFRMTSSLLCTPNFHVEEQHLRLVIRTLARSSAGTAVTASSMFA